MVGNAEMARLNTSKSVAHDAIGAMLGGLITRPREDDPSVMHFANTTRPLRPRAPRDVVPMSFLNGPCFCKMLVPNHMAGVIIGRNGLTIGEIELVSDCRLQVSATDSFFPGTKDRIAVMSGNAQQLEECIKQIIKRLAEFSFGPSSDRFMLKLAVPRSSVSKLIGNSGRDMQSLGAQTGARINVSERLDHLQERIVIISGHSVAVEKATLGIVRLIQADPHLSEHLTLTYNVELPLGAWERRQVLDQNVELINPVHVKQYTKQELIEYLRKAATRDILMRHGLLGEMKNIKKGKTMEKISLAVSETWRSRGGNPYHEAVAEAEEVWNREEETPAVPQPVALPVGQICRDDQGEAYGLTANGERQFAAVQVVQLPSSAAAFVPRVVSALELAQEEDLYAEPCHLQPSLQVSQEVESSAGEGKNMLSKFLNHSDFEQEENENNDDASVQERVKDDAQGNGDMHTMWWEKVQNDFYTVLQERRQRKPSSPDATAETGQVRSKKTRRRQNQDHSRFGDPEGGQRASPSQQLPLRENPVAEDPAWPSMFLPHDGNPVADDVPWASDVAPSQLHADVVPWSSDVAPSQQPHETAAPSQGCAARYEQRVLSPPGNWRAVPSLDATQSLQRFPQPARGEAEYFRAPQPARGEAKFLRAGSVPSSHLQDTYVQDQSLSDALRLNQQLKAALARQHSGVAPAAQQPPEFRLIAEQQPARWPARVGAEQQPAGRPARESGARLVWQ